MIARHTCRSGLNTALTVGSLYNYVRSLSISYGIVYSSKALIIRQRLKLKRLRTVLTYRLNTVSEAVVFVIYVKRIVNVLVHSCAFHKNNKRSVCLGICVNKSRASSSKGSYHRTGIYQYTAGTRNIRTLDTVILYRRIIQGYQRIGCCVYANRSERALNNSIVKNYLTGNCCVSTKNAYLVKLTGGGFSTCRKIAVIRLDGEMRSGAAVHSEYNSVGLEAAILKLN